MDELQNPGLLPGSEAYSGDLFALTMRGAQVAMTIADARQPDHPVIFANDAFLALTGYGREEVLGRNCRFLQGERTDRAAVARLGRAIAAGEPMSLDLVNYRKDGAAFWNGMHVSPVRDGAGATAYFLGVHHDVTDRKEAEFATVDTLEGEVDAHARKIERALTQKTALLHEIDHRVKNNLQLVSSLLLLQSRRLEDEKARAALRGMLERVSAIATVHRRLFQSEDVERFDVAEFVRDLVGDLMGSAGRSDVQVALDLERVDIPAAQAAPLALIVNELLCNALKHAFVGGRSGRIEVAIHRRDGGFAIVVRDDGVGAAGLDAQPRSFGLTIVQLLSQQLRAECRFEDSQPGVRATVIVPVAN